MIALAVRRHLDNSSPAITLGLIFLPLVRGNKNGIPSREMKWKRKMRENKKLLLLLLLFRKSS